MGFEVNTDWRNNGTPESGDLVHLKLVRTWVYKIKVIVQDVTGDLVTGVVDCIFDWQTEGHIQLSEVNDLIGKTLKFQKNMIFKLIKEKEARS